VSVSARKVAVFAFPVLLAVGAVVAAAQESIRVDVNLVTVAFSVRDTKLTPRNEYGIRVMDRIAKETGGMPIDAEKN
jgi:hypothetical protein